MRKIGETTPHKWAKVIHAFADGSPIQMRYMRNNGTWSEWSDTTGIASSSSVYEYRIKPEKKPDVEVTTALRQSTCAKDMIISEHPIYAIPNVKCTFDGDTGKLKAVELIS